MLLLLLSLKSFCAPLSSTLLGLDDRMGVLMISLFGDLGSAFSDETVDGTEVTPLLLIDPYFGKNRRGVLWNLLEGERGSSSPSETILPIGSFPFSLPLEGVSLLLTSSSSTT